MAAIVYKITYKNHCTPQEYITENSRWYLDSDVGAKLTGTAVVNFATTEPYFLANDTLDAAEVDLLFTGGKDFLYVKNTGEGGFNICFNDEDHDGSEADGYRVYLGPGECFASKITSFTCVLLKGVVTTTYEYISAT